LLHSTAKPIARRVTRHSSASKPKRMTNAGYLKQTLALQLRSLQLQREKLRVDKEKVETLKAIATELTSLRNLYCVVHGVQVVVPECTEEE